MMMMMMRWDGMEGRMGWEEKKRKNVGRGGRDGGDDGVIDVGGRSLMDLETATTRRDNSQPPGSSSSSKKRKETQRHPSDTRTHTHTKRKY